MELIYYYHCIQGSHLTESQEFQSWKWRFGELCMMLFSPVSSGKAIHRGILVSSHNMCKRITYAPTTLYLLDCHYCIVPGVVTGMHMPSMLTWPLRIECDPGRVHAPLTLGPRLVEIL